MAARFLVDPAGNAREAPAPDMLTLENELDACYETCPACGGKPYAAVPAKSAAKTGAE